MKVSFSEYQFAKKQLLLLILKNQFQCYSKKDVFLKKMFRKDVTNFKRNLKTENNYINH